jgi:nucleoside-diphosphate-sugar epimerase
VEVSALTRSDGSADAHRPVAAVTGGTGYLGSVLEPALEAAGYSVRRLVRSPRAGTDDRLFILGTPVEAAHLAGVDVLLHCAYDMGVTRRTDIWERNVFGTIRLLDAAIAAEVRRPITVSSMSAYPGTRQLYGRAKLDTELAALARGVAVVRPGLVYGPGWGGMAGTLRRLARLPALPDFGNRAVQFTVHENDLVTAVLAIASAEEAPTVAVGIAHPAAVPFRELLTALAVGQGRAAPRFVPVPPALALAALRAAESAGIPLPVRADSLLGLIRPASAVRNVDVLPGLGVTLRSFDPIMPEQRTGRDSANEMDRGGESHR